MILRLGANAALHAAGGVVLGVTALLAACTLAQLAKRASEEGGLCGRMRNSIGEPNETGSENPIPPAPSADGNGLAGGSGAGL